MKRIVLFFVVSLILSVSHVLSAFGADSLSGLWREVSDSAIQDSYVIVSERGSSIAMSQYFYHRDLRGPFVWHGQCNRDANAMTCTLDQTLIPPGVDRDVRLSMTISPDRRTFTGKWSDTKGHSGAVRFEKVKP